MDLVLINKIAPEVWDQKISQFKTRHLFHCSSWLNFLQETQSATPLKFEILVNGSTQGYFVGLLSKKGFFKILGSPLSGWETEQMGPIVNPGLDYHQFLIALDRYCRKWGIHQIEIGNPDLCDDSMKHHGYERIEWNTFLIPVYHDPEQMWVRLKSKCRNRIRKGLQNNLVVEDCSNPLFIDEHYRQLIDVYGRQYLQPPFPISFFKSLFMNLKADKRLYTLQVKKYNQVIASGIFAHDDHTVYSLSTSSYRRYLQLYPNELLHWTLMSMAGNDGITTYNLGDNYRDPVSGGKFKDKFNGKQQRVLRYVKSYSALARYGRKAYKVFYQGKNKLSGIFPMTKKLPGLNA